MNQQQQQPVVARPRLDALTGLAAGTVAFFGGGYIGLLCHNAYAAVVGMIVIFAVIVNFVRRRRMARAAAPAAEVPTVPYAPYGPYDVTGDPRYQQQ